MITQEIKKYEYNYAPIRQHTLSPVVYNPHRPTIHVDKFMDKLDFANYVRDLPIKKNDLVIPYYMSLEDLNQFGMFKVRDIQEIHYLAPIKAAKAGPECLILENITGHSFTGGGDYYRVLDKAYWPASWKEVMDVSP